MAETETGPVALRLDEKIEFVTDGIVSKTLAEGDFGEVEIFCVSAGQALSEHTASRAAALHFIKGRGRFKLGDEWHDALPGSWFFMPPGLPHALEAQDGLVFVLTLFGPGG
ncbi:MAG: cupin domain-containing protein [Armatimonadota bacterium]|nr:cupin domain-containing protein [Armatimonadota bacterium]